MCLSGIVCSTNVKHRENDLLRFRLVSFTDSSVWPGLTSIFLPEKRRHLLLSRSEQQQLEATDLLQIDLLDSAAVSLLPPSLPFLLSSSTGADSLPLMLATVYQSGSATVANLNPILRSHFLCGG